MGSTKYEHAQKGMDFDTANLRLEKEEANN